MKKGMHLIKVGGAVILLSFGVSGCTTTETYSKRAAYHEKARSYYQSIGQPQAAMEHNQLAQKNRDRADDLGPIVVGLWQLIFDKNE